MNTLTIASLSLLGLSAVSAHAGNYIAPDVVSTTVAAPNMTDWSGTYLGALGSFSTGTQVESWEDGFGGYADLEYNLDGSMYGAFAGYNIQNGSFVYGIEAAYMAGDVLSGDYTLDSNTGWSIYDLRYNSIFDLKARAGVATDKALLYAFVGGSTSQFEALSAGLVLGGPYSASGFNYGVGVDVLVSEKIFLGAEYIVRDLSADYGADSGGWVVEGVDIQSMQIRAGIKF